ncbi:hypothetical protein TCAL_09290 [Tigriopus californicus]|uniref:Uncharacterized protein n=1 Tax=Tigriopus californicus TaxID=6832 RepID=A0A553P0L1_TIGCA|nr:hypothetical protein TCAL_09290 [Tigriopus californicus]
MMRCKLRHSEDLAGHPLLVARPRQKIRKLTPTGSVSSEYSSSIPPAKIVPCNQSKTVKLLRLIYRPSTKSL